MHFRLFSIMALLAPVTMQCCRCPHPGITLSPTVLTFPAQVVSPSAPPGTAQPVTVKSTGYLAALQIKSISASGDYSQTNDCPVAPATLPMNATCTIQVTFAPNAVASINGAVTVDSNAGNHTVALSGQGISSVGFSPSSLAFNSTPVGATSASQAIILTNNQSGNLTITAISASGDYSAANGNCPMSPATLAAGATCTINVTFSPTVNGSIPGVLTVATDAMPGTQPVALTGQGTGSVTVPLSLSPPSLDFGNKEAGATSTSQAITVTNTSSTTSTSFTISASANYSETDNCSGNLSASASCTVNVTFNPAANFVPIAYPGAITVTDGSFLEAVGLSGTAVAALSASPAQVTFQTFEIGLTPPEQTVTLTNNDSSPQSVAISSFGPFAISSSNNNCPASPATLASGSQCTLGVDWTSGNGGPSSGALDITEPNGFLHPQVVSLSACSTFAVLSPQSINFGVVPLHATSQTESVSVFNADPGNALTINSATITGANAGEFAISNNTCGSSVSSGSLCEIDITLTPTASGTRSAALNLDDNEACSPQLTTLTGGSSAGPFTVTMIGVLTFFNGAYESRGGTITSTPTGINCGSSANTCSASFPAGTNVSLTETPDSGATFLGWGNACSGSASCSISLNTDAQVSANFAEPLQMTLAGTGTGTVTSSPAGISCKNGGGTCGASFPFGTSVTLTATPDPPYGFLGWSGACSGDPCTFTMNANQQVTATFNPYANLTVTTGGAGTGTVTSSPSGITCGGSGPACTAPFVQGSTVNLTANPDSGDGVGNWGGTCASAGNGSTCSVTMSAAEAASATFLPPDFTVSASSPTEIVSRGTMGSNPINIAPAFGSFSAAVQLTCSISGPSPMPGCSFSPPSVSLQSGPASSNLIVNASGLSAGLMSTPDHELSRRLYALLLLLPLVTVVLARVGRQRGRRLGFITLLLVLAALQLSCGGGTKSPPPPETFTVTITGTSGALVHSTSVIVTVE